MVADCKHFAVTPPLASNRYNGDDDLHADAPSRACSSFVVTDRPFYSPGDTVFFNAWLAAFNDKFRPFADSDCTAILIGMDRKELLSTKLKTDAAGVASGSITLPKDLDTNSCRIGIKADAVVLDVFSPSFTVGNYAPPGTMLHFLPVAEPLVAGDDFDVRIHASYIKEKSAAGRKVNCSVRIVESIDTDRFDSNDGDDDDDDDFDSYDGTPLYGNGNSAYEPSWYPAWKTLHMDAVAIRRRMPPVSRDYEIELDGNGDGRIRINTSQIIKEHGRRDLFVALKAELADGAEVRGNDSMDLFLLDRAYKVQLHPPATYAVAGKPFAVGVEVTTFGMEPLSAHGRLRLLKVVCGDNGSMTENPLPWQEFETDIDGKAVVMVVPPEAGHYRVLAEVETAGKGKGACSDMILAWKDGEQLNGERFNGVELHLDKTEYNVGDVAKLLVCNDRADIPVFLIKYICGRPQPIEAVPISGKCAVVEFKVTEEMALGAGIAAYSPGPDNKCENAAVPIKTSFGRPLSLKLTPRKSEMRPGETAEVSIELHDSDGKPVEANIVVAVHDASIDCLDNKAATSLYAAMNHFSAERKYAFPDAWKYSAIQNSLWKAFPRGNYSKAGIPPDFFQMALSEHDDFGRDLEKFRMQNTEFDTVSSTAEAFCRRPKISIFRRDKPPQFEWRSEFHGTAFWKADIKTDAAGKAVVSFKLPAATTWKVNAWAATDDARYGENTAYIYCNK